MNAKLGMGPFYAWRSIYIGKTLLKTCLMWRVGNGYSINLWHEKWIPSLPFFKVHSPRATESWCEKLSDIIDPRQRSWKEDLLLEMFSTLQIKAIKSIPISFGATEEKLIWNFTANGQYTVKSGYHHQR